MKTFYYILANTLLVSVTNFFVWFALVFWLYLETQSVLTTSLIGGIFMAVTAVSGFLVGSFVDHNKKKHVMLISSVLTLFFFTAALGLYALAPADAFLSAGNPILWTLVLLTLGGVIAGNLRNIAFPTLVTILIPEDKRDKANGLAGMVMGISSVGAGLTSGFALAYLGMFWVFAIASIITILAILHLAFLPIPENTIVHTEEKPKKIDIAGTIKAISGISGLFGLIFFTTFNNFLGGVFMALMDPYGLSLVSVQVWGALWGVLSSGFILGGLYIARYGLGKNPLRTLLRNNVITWTVCIFFAIQPSIALLAIGTFIWICLAPFIEATEHTIIQKVVPLERQGRVFGFAQSVETAAMPLTAFIIGPIAQFLFIPFMTTGAGVELIGDWFGTGAGRGIALIFTIAGIIGLCVTLLAMRSRSYKLLSAMYTS